ncbi:hypothetical protein [Acinetobacter johnsonii]|uniref:hypothetical protein n=1 Tax=Acinetobacter johnsonii TaxID=40214 RepID=UPI0024937964|nr:hypothetical protein [Acinetobacter johnsonii]
MLQWQKGDVALIDNIKIDHWRMNGKQGQRKLMQIQANVFNADSVNGILKLTPFTLQMAK